MNKWIIGAAALLAVAAPGVAAAQTGYVGAVYSDVDLGGGAEGEAYGIEGSVAWTNFELDASFLDSDDTDTTTSVTGHLFSRNDRYLFGGFAGMADNDGDTLWQVGIEGAKYYDRWTLFGSLAYGEADDADAEAIGVNIGASLFATDNFRIDANVLWADVESGGGDDNALGFGIGAEYQFASVPISIGASYANIELDDANVDADVFTIGIRYNFGGSLYDRDRSGASQASRAGLGNVLSF